MSEQASSVVPTSASSSRRSSFSQGSHRRGLSGITPRELKCIDDVIPLDRRQKWKKYSAKPIENREDFESEFVRNVETTLGRSLYNCDALAAYQATARSLRDTLIVRWNRTQQKQTLDDPKRVYYLSLEFLMGRALDNAALNLGLEGDLKTGLDDFGFRFEDIVDREPDAGLGNGGLGRLAACFVDSLCTLDYPAWAYGIRYKYGIFKQKIVDGAQVEFPDAWLDFGNPWEIPRPEVSFDVMFYGRVEEQEGGKKKWLGGNLVEAKAYDFLVPGFETNNVNTLRLWQAEPSSQFDFASFNEGEYRDAVVDQVDSSTISAVLYPNDNFHQGKELRLKQQYFWVAASLGDILRRYKKTRRPLSEFADSCAIQLNDTHPTLAIVELLRLLIDQEGLDWHEAWAITTSTFAYTNHTVMPEALEKWGIDILGNLLPRHLELIYQVNFFFLKDVAAKFPGDDALQSRVSLIEESTPKQVRMAYLAVIASHKVNGVAELHSDLIKTTIFADFVKIFGEEHFTNITNGITPRRWLLEANPQLAALIASKLGGIDFVKNLDRLQELSQYVNDKEFRQQWNKVKQANKARLVELIKTQNPDIEIDPTSLFDVQVKRIHEYKRQQLNLFGIVYRYLYLKSLSPEQRRAVAPRVFIFGGKSAPGYYAAKLIIKLINSVAKTIESEPEISKYLKVVYIEDYNVSKAQILAAASDISEHISTAGTEASGTSNMKFVLNGGLIIGTVDGANIEIGREIGEDNIYYFGHLSEAVEDVRAETKNGVKLSDKLSKVFETIDSGVFGDASEFSSLLDSIRKHGDYYLVNADFDSYINTQSKIDEDFKDKERWTTKSITSVSKMGFFSSDRAINQYAEEIWDVQPNPVEGPDPLSPKASNAALNQTVSASQGTVAERKAPKKNKRNSTVKSNAPVAAAAAAAAAAVGGTAASAAKSSNGTSADVSGVNTSTREGSPAYDPTGVEDEGQVTGAYGSYADKPAVEAKSASNAYDPATPGDDSQATGAYGSYADKSTAATKAAIAGAAGTGAVGAGAFGAGASGAGASGVGSSAGASYNPVTAGDEGQVTGAYGSYADKPTVNESEPASYGSADISGACYATTSGSVPAPSSGTLDSTKTQEKRASGIFNEISSASSLETSSGEAGEAEPAAGAGVTGLHRNLVDPASISTGSIDTTKANTSAADKSFTGPSSQEVPQADSSWSDKATGLVAGGAAAVVGGAAALLATAGGATDANTGATAGAEGATSGAAGAFAEDSRDTSTPISANTKSDVSGAVGSSTASESYKTLDPAAQNERYVTELGNKSSAPIVTDGVQSANAPVKSVGTETGPVSDSTSFSAGSAGTGAGAGTVGTAAAGAGAAAAGGIASKQLKNDIPSADASIVSLDSRTAIIPDSGATVSGRFAQANEASDRNYASDGRRHSRSSFATTGETDFEDAEDYGTPEPHNRAGTSGRDYDAQSISSQSTIGKNQEAPIAGAAGASGVAATTGYTTGTSSAPISTGSANTATTSENRPNTAATTATSVSGDSSAQNSSTQKVSGGNDVIPTNVLEQSKKQVGGGVSALEGPPIDKSKVQKVHEEVIDAAKADGETQGIVTGAASAAAAAEKANAPGKHANKEEDLPAPDKKSCRCC